MITLAELLSLTAVLILFALVFGGVAVWSCYKQSQSNRRAYTKLFSSDRDYD